MVALYSILLAGGSGSRLWPMSREMFPKQMFKLDDEEKTGLLGGLVLLMFGVIISLLLAYAHKQSIEQNATKPAKTVCIQVDQNGNITEVKKED